MLEKDMEELIARFPLDFFPRNNFILIGRQGFFAGVGRYDLLFQDTRGIKILMELKARPAKYQDADQLAKYYDSLKLKGEKNILLWLVATNIPHSIREFLDNVGIEHTEIHENEYYRIADKNDYKVTPDINPAFDYPNSVDKINVSKPKPTRNIMYKSKISKEFRNDLEKMRNYFESAFNFLTEIENGQFEGFMLRTVKNAHLYYKDAFYIYIKLSITKIELNSNFNKKIVTSTKDNSNLLFFSPIKKMIGDLDGFNLGWANISGDGITLTNKTPSQFFEKLIELITSMHK